MDKKRYLVGKIVIPYRRIFLDTIPEQNKQPPKKKKDER